nr:MAG TPA: hypothetical protein [Caudoviricetes sp.]
MPDFYSTLWVTVELRNQSAVNTISSSVMSKCSGVTVKPSACNSRARASDCSALRTVSTTWKLSLASWQAVSKPSAPTRPALVINAIFMTSP